MAATAAVLGGMVVFLVSCTLLFPFKAANPDRAQEIRLPPPPQAPVFGETPREAPVIEAKSRFGAALAAGHFTRHERDPKNLELAVGAPGADGGTGQVVIYRKDVDGEHAETITPVESGKFAVGAALAAGDFDGDGIDDLAIGAPDLEGVGAVGMRYADGPDIVQIDLPDAPRGRRGFGSALAAGDLDGNGVVDLVVGEPGESRGGRGDPGRVWVLWGTAGRQLDTDRSTVLTIPAGDEQDADTRFGASLAVGNFVLRPDRSQPVLPDLAIGAPSFDRTDGHRKDLGRVYVFRPLLPAPQQDGFGLAATLEPEGGWEHYAREFGRVLASGNFNGDRDGQEAKDDLAIGAPRSSAPEIDHFDDTLPQPPEGRGKTGAGLVFIAPHGDTRVTAPLRVLDQDRMGFSEPKDAFGTGLAAGDFNRDGIDDLAIGSPDERMAPVGLLGGLSQAGAVYFRFGNPGSWAAGGGIPQVPQACFDYIDAVRGGRSRKGDRFGSVLLAARYDDDDAVDLIVGAPETDVVVGDAVRKDAGVVWIGRNQETTVGVFEGCFTGDFRDDECGGAEAAGVTLKVRHREGAVCGTLETTRDLCFDVEDQDVVVQRIDVAVATSGVDAGLLHLEYDLFDREDDRVGMLSIDAETGGADDDLSVTLGFAGSGVERTTPPLTLTRSDPAMCEE